MSEETDRLNCTTPSLSHKRSYSLRVVSDVILHHDNNMVVWHPVLVEDLVGVAHIGLGEKRHPVGVSIMPPGDGMASGISMNWIL